MPPKKRTKQRQPPWTETRAAAIVEAVTGASLKPLDVPPLQNFADFTLHLPGHSPGVLEVTSHGDPARGSLNDAMRQRQYEFPRPELSKFWSLYLPPLGSEHHRRYKDVLKDLDTIVEVLGVLEARNELRIDRTFDPRDRPHESEILLRLGVDWGYATNTGPPTVFFIEPGDGGGSGTAAVVGAGLAEARKADNLAKLRKGTGDGAAASRHLFVWIMGTKMLPYFALSDRKLPTEPPDLPEPITDLWIAGRYRTGEVVWRWDGDVWTDVTPALSPPVP